MWGKRADSYPKIANGGKCGKIKEGKEGKSRRRVEKERVLPCREVP